MKRVLSEMTPARAHPGERLVATYYDTPDRALKRRGLVLRVREQGGRFVQTVKAGDLTGTDILARGEWEDAVDENRPDPRAPQSGTRLPRAVTGDLRPLFVTDVTRTTIEIEPDPATRIEAAIDEGEIRGVSGEGIEPISEIELELKSGNATSLYDLALRLLDAAPLRIEMRSKSDRGHRLVDGASTAPSAVHAEPVPLDSSLCVEAAFQKIGRSCLVQLLGNEPAVLAGQPEGVHQMRVAVRRLRSAISNFKEMLPAEDIDWSSSELRWLTGALARARNLDAFEIDLLEPARDVLRDEPGLEGLAAAIDRLRRAAYERVREEILSKRYTVMLLRLFNWFEAQGWRNRPPTGGPALACAPLGGAALRLLDRRRRRLRQRSMHFERLTPRQRHKLRIAGKKFRYTSELFGSLFDQHDLQKFTKRLGRLQDDLGHANDVIVARDLLQQLYGQAQPGNPVADAGARLLEWHERALAKNERKLRQRLRRLNDAAPFWRARS